MNRLKIFCFIMVMALLTGCATELKSSSRASVIVENMSWNQNEADRLAELECQKNGRNAVLTSRVEDSARSYYQCVD